MEFDGTGGFPASYAPDDRVDQPLVMTRGGQDYYIQADHQGSVIRVTDSAGAVVNSYEYDAFGQRFTALDGVEIACSYNAVGAITRIAEPAAADRNFGYDALQRLVSGGTVASPETCSYDAEGNRLAMRGCQFENTGSRQTGVTQFFNPLRNERPINGLKAAL